MVAKFISGKSLIGALNYNERKVSKGTATLIGENRYGKMPQELTFYEKLDRLTNLVKRNERVRTNTIHISLNFSTEDRLNLTHLKAIASEYMEQIGFGDQPYLVYQHHDAAHPHIHIITTNIKPSSERISLHNIGKTKSEEARQAIELKYGLVQASLRESLNSRERLVKAVYGQCETKRVITNIVNEVVKTYKFTSIPELNAVLNQYNVAADRGSKESRMFANNGLIYWILTEKGEKIGVPVKASNIYGKPTLKNLEAIFQKNEQLRKPHKDRLKKQINEILITRASQAGFQQALSSKGIQVIFRWNDQGRLYGVTYVDHVSRVVFNGSDLGKAYSAAALASRFANTCATKGQGLPAVGSDPSKPKQTVLTLPREPVKAFGPPTLLADLFRTDFEGVSPELLKRKKKRKRHL